MPTSEDQRSVCESGKIHLSSKDEFVFVEDFEANQTDMNSTNGLAFCGLHSLHLP